MNTKPQKKMTYGKLTVLRLSKNPYVSPSGWKHPRWVCRCECGKLRRVLQKHLVSGNCRSCGGCGRKTHGQARTQLYMVWSTMKSRCYRKANEHYKRYGARGIQVYGKWRDDFSKFQDYVLKVLGKRPSRKHSLDRIDNDGDYAPGNLRWATPTQQTANREITRRVLYKGNYVTTADLAKQCDVPSLILYERIFKLEWAVRKAMTTPVRSWKRD